MIDFVATSIAFFATVDPIGTVPVFVAVTQHRDEAARPRLALIAAGVSAAMLLCFVAAGETILRAMNIPLPAFCVGGGLVLVLFALTMIFGESKPGRELTLADKFLKMTSAAIHQGKAMRTAGTPGRGWGWFCPVATPQRGLESHGAAKMVRKVTEIAPAHRMP